MIVCRDYHHEEHHKNSSNVKIFDVKGINGREKLEQHLEFHIDFKAKKMRLIWGRTIYNALRQARLTDDMLSYLVSSA